mmetsp:Transcript_1820/g.4215  ORF Transcript_1820/g.4215 Transcript_1820/m.4215 type:complete len:226 (+) Transcript_1820:542-1219(+)
MVWFSGDLEVCGLWLLLFAVWVSCCLRDLQACAATASQGGILVPGQDATIKVEGKGRTATSHSPCRHALHVLLSRFQLFWVLVHGILRFRDASIGVFDASVDVWQICCTCFYRDRAGVGALLSCRCPRSGVFRNCSVASDAGSSGGVHILDPHVSRLPHVPLQPRARPHCSLHCHCCHWGSTRNCRRSLCDRGLPVMVQLRLYLPHIHLLHRLRSVEGKAREGDG